MNVEAVVLNLLLKSKEEDRLARFAELKREYFSPIYASILHAIGMFYEGMGRIPNMDELLLKYERSPQLSQSLNFLNISPVPEIDDYDFAVEVLKDQFTQEQYLALISKSLDGISMKSSSEIMDEANAIPLKLEESIRPKTFIHTARDISIFKDQKDADEDVMYTGISNLFDSTYGATRRGEVFLVGGRRGAGKSVICINIARKSVQEGKLFVPYFSIEMSAEETMLRYVGISSGVDAIKVRNQNYQPSDLVKMANFRASMFTNGAEILATCKNLENMADLVELDKKFAKEGIEDPESGLIVIDDPELKLSAIDMYLTNLKAKHGKKIGTVIVDYINQIVVDGCNDANMYDWKNQIVIAKKLKALARKHEVTIFAPYQIDDKGEARMAKGILDSCDFAYTVEAVHGKEGAGALKWSGTKARSLPTIDFAVPIDWDTLEIGSVELTPHELAALTGVDAKEEKEVPKDKGWNNPGGLEL